MDWSAHDISVVTRKSQFRRGNTCMYLTSPLGPTRYTMVHLSSREPTPGCYHQMLHSQLGPIVRLTTGLPPPCGWEAFNIIQQSKLEAERSTTKLPFSKKESYPSRKRKHKYRYKGKIHVLERKLKLLWFLSSLDSTSPLHTRKHCIPGRQ